MGNSPVCWEVLASHYPPQHVGGGELSDHAILKAANTEGRQVRVWVPVTASTSESQGWYEGIQVIRSRWAHAGFARAVRSRRCEWGWISGRPVRGFLRLNRSCRLGIFARDRQVLPWLKDQAAHFEVVVVPSRWFAGIVRREASRLKDEQIIVSPPSVPFGRQLPARNGRFITLVSAERHKGLDLFLKLASIWPERDFLVADNLHPWAIHQLQQAIRGRANVFALTRHQRMDQVYYLTDWLLMPSVPSQHVETFGRVAVEALDWGIIPLTYELGGPTDYLPPDCFVPRRESSLADQAWEWRRRLEQLQAFSPEKRRNILYQAREMVQELDLPGAARRTALSLIHWKGQN